MASSSIQSPDLVEKNVEFHDSSGRSESEQDYDIEELENFDSSNFSERSNSSDSEVNICVGDSYSSFAKKSFIFGYKS